MNEEGETYHKHLEELEPADIAKRVRAETALCDWLISRTDQRVELLRVWRPSRSN